MVVIHYSFIYLILKGKTFKPVKSQTYKVFSKFAHLIVLEFKR